MEYLNKYHLTYCTNVHAAETWEETFKKISSHVIPLKAGLAPQKNFGIGLRLSDLAAKELISGDNLKEFKEWLEKNALYVFTINGFPFGRFHGSSVKDDVHTPDWTTEERYNYTLNLIHILSDLLPEYVETGSISTSPLSYRFWQKNEENKTEIFRLSCRQLAKIAEELHLLKRENKKTITICIEPEPDGLIESSAEAVQFFLDALIPLAGGYLQERLNVSFETAKEILLEHLTVCYDVCHSALLYEDPEEVLEAFEKAKIRIGKIQLSSAIKFFPGKKNTQRTRYYNKLAEFADSVYLHQVVARKADAFERYPDLGPALGNIFTTEALEWRIHFHVPIFIENYSEISSTQDQLKKVLELLKKKSYTRHLEIETYTWEVLPKEMKLKLVDSIEREYKWVLQTTENNE